MGPVVMQRGAPARYESIDGTESLLPPRRVPVRGSTNTGPVGGRAQPERANRRAGDANSDRFGGIEQPPCLAQTGRQAVNE